ncbi:MAG: KEOPS complex kinase/ATPase Bud32 [Candidatus Micrarchaeaceae archaeon]
MSMRKISEGAESDIYAVDFLGMGCVLKRRSKKEYRIREIDDKIRATRTRKEARIMGSASSIGISSPRLLLVDKYDIIMTRANGRNLNDILNSKTDSYDINLIFRRLGLYAAMLHNNGMVHGDYTPANVMIEGRSNVHIIDFGLADATASIEDKALDVLLMKRSIDSASFSTFAKSYKRSSKDAAGVFGRLADIEKRGRYSTRTLSTGNGN